ncbi:LLM class flavin-dependent oxidoreductase [Neolewinella aurantiaca]|uniref:Luciferase-like monooxygenase n=1 Tax=Neolewinella aurantiaca TaxID=2602767 RepID=A0A5C7FC61_9BACT|nr:LLM class flavin-dependent oxidoreductase [Neolewinella aurantiaca]TXF87058.1 LLM class flavin-dependent oxidoreductase [Neolewinella aurantiaca]
MYSQAIAYSILELAVVSKGDPVSTTFANSLALAQAAEAAGYKRFWLAEHHNTASVGSNSPPVLIGHIAGGTKTLRVGSGGVMLPNHSPLVVAEQFGTLGNLYPNRIDLGLGRAPGTDQVTAQAIRSDFMQAAHSFPREIEKIQQYFSPDNQHAAVRAPVAEGVDVPLYILGSSTDSAHLAAKKGLPYAFASHFATAQLFNALEIYHREFKPSVQLEKPYTIAGVNIVVADTDEEAERLYTSILRMFIGLVTGNRDFLQPPTDMTDELRGALRHPTISQMLKFSFVGSKETVKAQVEEFLQQTGVDELIAATAIYNHEDRFKSYALFAEIMQEINATAKPEAAGVHQVG